ncbi:MAG: GNAT family N-acetyltransferase [Parachlamydiaceae bacterium]|nr:GNAT family N-acetyltransferase [Parachlamydiaceae bacterium]
MQKNIETFNLILSSPCLEDLSALVDFENRNRTHLSKWESISTFKLENNISPDLAILQRLENWIKECAEGKSVRFFIRAKANPEVIIGFCNFTQIFHGAFQACYLGYKIDYEYEGKGLMFEALEAGIKQLFEGLGIHRIMANYMPNNKRSAKVLDRLGFTVEGYAKNYLFINNHWEDHVLTALSFEQWQKDTRKIISSLSTPYSAKKSSLIPELTVFNFKKSLGFYTQLVGFQILYERPENDFAMLEKNDAQIMIEGFTGENRFGLTGKIEKPLGLGMHFQLQVQDVQSLYQTFKNAEYPIFFEMEEKWYRIGDQKICHDQFLVQDPDGYLLRFFQYKFNGIEMDATQHFPTKNEIELLMKEKKVPGISLAIIEKGKIALNLEIGLKNSKNNDSINTHTLFEAASLSKPVFAYGFLKLVEKKILDLDKPLVEYFSYPDMQNDKKRNFITARMVLNHTCGFPNWRPKDAPLKIHFQPGERFSYSGEGFLYLQKVVEHLTGLTLEEYMQKNVFIPLEMNHSTFIWVNDNKKTSGHDAEGNPIENCVNIPQNSAFTLHTNALDYGKFVTAVLNEEGLKSETFMEMFKPQIRVQEGCINSIETYSEHLSDSISWGLGWGLQCSKSGDSFWHWGDNHGFKCFVVGFKDSKNAIIIFTNSANGLALISDVIQKHMAIPQPAFDWLKNGYLLSNQKF